jgi:hypothetical protein
MAVPVIVVTGTIGVGKSTIGTAMHEIMYERRMPHACVDIDWLRMSWPERGSWNSEVAIANLASTWKNFRDTGAERLVIVDVVEQRAHLERYRTVVPGAEIQVCRLIAPQATREQRITVREQGASREWHLARSMELDAILDAANVADFAVDNGDRPMLDVATEVLAKTRWIS